MFRFYKKMIVACLISFSYTAVNAEISDMYFAQIKKQHEVTLTKDPKHTYHYFRLDEDINDVKASHFFLVITSADLCNKESCREIEALAQQHGEKLVLIVDLDRDGEIVTQSGYLHLTPDDLPKNVCSVHMCNLSSNVTALHINGQEFSDAAIQLLLTPSLTAQLSASQNKATNAGAKSADPIAIPQKAVKLKKEEMDDSDCDDDDNYPLVAPSSPQKDSKSSNEGIILLFEKTRTTLMIALSSLEENIATLSNRLDEIDAQVDALDEESGEYLVIVDIFSTELDDLIEVAESLYEETVKCHTKYMRLITSFPDTKGIDLSLEQKVSNAVQGQLSEVQEQIQDIIHDKMVACGETDGQDDAGDENW